LPLTNGAEIILHLQVSRVLLFIRPDGWDALTSIEVRVGSNGSGTALKDNSLCDKSFVGPPAKGVDFVVVFICQNIRGRFVSLQRTLSSSALLSVAHVRIETGPTQGQSTLKGAVLFLKITAFVISKMSYLRVETLARSVGLG
jgi:hypothetical protein